MRCTSADASPRAAMRGADFEWYVPFAKDAIVEDETLTLTPAVTG